MVANGTLLVLIFCGCWVVLAGIQGVFSTFLKERVVDSRIAKNLDVKIAGNVRYHLVDTNADGIYEALSADVDVEILTKGFYTITGALKKNGKIVSNQPAFEYAMSTEVIIGDRLGIHMATLAFSGEQIRRSRKDGPYQLEVIAIGTSFDKKNFTTPAYNHTLFGERGNF